MIIINYNWLFLRLSVILLFISYWLDFEIILISINFLFLHINIGFKSIIFDYLHLQKISIFLFSLLRISLIINLVQIVEIYF